MIYISQKHLKEVEKRREGFCRYWDEWVKLSHLNLKIMGF